MNLPNEFEYYLERGVVRRSGLNKSRAEFLIDGAGISMEGLRRRIKMMGVNKFNTNSIIKDCYDVVMELVRARLFLDGYSSSGNYAHEAEVSYLLKMGFSRLEVSFLNELRYFRNSITYYGKVLDVEYAERVFGFLKRVYDRLKKMADDKLSEVKHG